jgi:hypothetical protein
MASDNTKFNSNVLIALVGSRPLVVDLDDWVPGTIEAVTDTGVIITFDGEEVWTVVFNG